MKNFLKSLLSKTQSAGGPNPSRDWLMLLAVALLLLAGSVAWNAWYFSQIEDGAPTASEGGEALEAYPAGLVQEIFAARATTSAAYRSIYPFIDPSR